MLQHSEIIGQLHICDKCCIYYLAIELIHYTMLKPQMHLSCCGSAQTKTG
jgi:hypothetical protein